MNIISLDHRGILEYQRNRPPFLFIDEAEEIVPGVMARGFKLLPPETWFFEPHFEGDPLMPGLLQIEALVQMAALMITTLPGHKGIICYLANAERIELRRRVVPGDRLDLATRMISFKRGIGRCEGEGTVGGEPACRATFTIAVPTILDALRPSPTRAGAS